MSFLKRKSVLLIGTELWGKVFVSKHHYAVNLAKDNQVWYVNPVNIPWSWKHLIRIPVQVVETEYAGLKVITYGNVFPRLNKLPRWLQAWNFSRVARRIMSSIQLSDQPVVWNFDLGRFFDPKVFSPRISILHLVELLDHVFFRDAYRFRHESCVNADIIFCVADKIATQVANVVDTPKFYFVNHGADIPSFEANLTVPPASLPGTNGIKAGFVGNFQVSFDFSLLETLANQFPHVDFVMIGPVQISNLGAQKPEVVAAISRMDALPNVFFVGAVPSDEIMRYLLPMDVNLILYDDNYTDGHCNAHKMMSYFYAGKVIVSSFMDQYKDRPDLVQMVETNAQFVSLFGKVMSRLVEYNSEAAIARRRAFAYDNSYTNQIALIDKLIEEHQARELKK